MTGNNIHKALVKVGTPLVHRSPYSKIALGGVGIISALGAIGSIGALLFAAGAFHYANIDTWLQAHHGVIWTGIATGVTVAVFMGDMGLIYAYRVAKKEEANNPPTNGDKLQSNSPITPTAEYRIGADKGKESDSEEELNAKETQNETHFMPRAEDLPSWVFSKNGNMCDVHFKYFLGKLHDPQERMAWIRWSFSQRKIVVGRNSYDPIYALIGAPSKAIPVDPDDLNSPSTLDGHAHFEDSFSPKARIDIDPIFISDEEITQKYECIRVETKPISRFQSIFIGYYPDGKSIIQQPGRSACIYTCAAMLLNDRGENYDFKALSMARATDNENLAKHVQAYGYELVELKETSDLQAWIEEHGSIFASTSSEALGGHRVIVDGVDTTNNNVTIRDPNHGWRIDLPLDQFKKYKPQYYGLRKKQTPS